jgi:hypothetical protein
MNISPNEAEEALAAIQSVTKKTRRSIANSGAYIFLGLTGIVWLVGFLATQFLTGEIVAYIWVGTSVLCSALSIILGRQTGRHVRGPSIGIFWLLLVLYAISIITISQPADGKQMSMFIILFIMLGQLGMGMLISYASVWWALPITALALVGYFLLPGIFYLWMGVLVGGGMILLGLYIHFRW